MGSLPIVMDKAVVLKELGVVRVSGSSEVVTDADEEVFLLYTELQAAGSVQLEDGKFRGLGHIDSRQDSMVISLEIKSKSSFLGDLDDIPSSSDTTTVAAKRRRKRKKAAVERVVNLEISISQDKTALRTRKGDTGSVLWKASVDFAQITLQQLHDNPNLSLLNSERLKQSHVIELGAGTGLLAVALSPHVQNYTATDISEIVPLLRKNMAMNFPNWGKSTSHPGSNIIVEALDWLALHSSPQSQRHRVVNLEPVDLILVVDCIYHPSLLPALVETINYVTIPNRTATLVVVELRQEDVIREFLQLWLDSGNWEIWRLDGFLGRPYAMWVGWKMPSEPPQSPHTRIEPYPPISPL